MVDKTAGGGALDLSWGASCAAANDYAIYEGTIGSWPSHSPVCCTTTGATARTVMASAGSSYYLVVPTDGVQEGSYGRGTDGNERAPGGGACLPQGAPSACP
jgi:hypothetical protein